MPPSHRSRKLPSLASSKHLIIFIALASFFAIDSYAQPPSDTAIAWFKAKDLDVEGVAFKDTENDFDRLPERAKDKVRKQVWDLSQFPSGVIVRFQTDSPVIHIKYDLANARLAMPHVPATAVSGVDLYAENDEGVMQWAAVLKPGNTSINQKLLDKIKSKADGSQRRFDLYMPLFNRPVNLEIGVDANSQFGRAPARTEKPILIYGTSIMHGACASRAGMSISSILGRRLNHPMINLGFSGNGRMELAVGQFIAELDPAVIVIDCLPNLNPQRVAERCEPLVRQLREAKPDTPILLVEDRVFTNAWIRSGADSFHKNNQAALRGAYDRLVAEGVKNLHYLPATNLLGNDHEGATDGSHPSDLGMMRYADAYEPVLRKIMGK